jgi:1,2-diacylglycerol 3-alpha-glucosyltransferase
VSDRIVTGMFNDSYAPITDGVAMVTRQYALWLNRKTGPSCVVTTNLPDYFDNEEFPVYRFPSLPINTRPPYRFGVAFSGEVKEQRQRGGIVKETLSTNIFRISFDLVHSHSPFVAGKLARIIANRQNIPLVTTFHTKYKPEFERALKMGALVSVAMQIIKDYYNKADFVWVPNAESIGVLREYGYSGEVEVMPNGTDLYVAGPDLPALRQEGSKLLGVDDESFVFLYIGQHIVEKNLDLVIESLAHLDGLNRPFKMIFVGDGKHRAAMEERVQSLGLSDRVQFLGIVRDREFIKRAYARADLLLFPSLYDTSSLTVKESAAMRLPAVLIRGSSTAEGIADGENGFMSENDPVAYAQTIQRAMSTLSLRRAAGDGAFRTLYNSWESVLEQVDLRYREILSQWKGR